jgi:hypothetical protein
LKFVDAGGYFVASLTTSNGGFRVLDHGGPDGPLSCGEELRVDTIAVNENQGVVEIALSGDQRTTEETYGVHTSGDNLRFDSSCACPLPGSAVDVDFPRPLGQDGTAHAKVSYGAPAKNDAEACASATVSLADWPKSCVPGLGDDCGAKATENTLSAILTATCLKP